jgi:DNA repair protein RadC
MSLRALSNRELLKMLVGTRKAEKLCETALASLLFAQEGSTHYVRELAAAREIVKRSLEEELRHTDSFSCPATVSNYLRALVAGYEHEVFTCLFLNNRHCLIVAEELFRGTIDGTSVHPREVVKRALALNAAAVIFAHNHPSGVAEPSQADISLTDRLKQALGLVDIRVLDHFVVTITGTISMAERGMV